MPGATDSRGRINFVEPGKGLPFAPQRLFWLHDVAPGQWRGRHGHRRTELLLVALQRRLPRPSRRRPDDRTRSCSTIRRWRCMSAPGCGTSSRISRPAPVVLAIASTLYDEAEYLRDYQVFKREVAGQP